MQIGVDFQLSFLPLLQEVLKSKNSVKVSIAWMDSRLPVKTSQALAEHVGTHHFFSTSTNAFELCEGNILIRLDSTSINEDQYTSTVDTSISEVEKGLPMSCPGWLVKMYFNMIVLLKMDILSSVTHSNVFLNMFDFFLLLNTKDCLAFFST